MLGNRVSNFIFKNVISRKTCSSFFQNLRQAHSALTRYVPRRAILYVPGHDKRKIEKVKTVNADCVVYDCEDGVALNKKQEARETIRYVLEKQHLERTEQAVRINSVNSGLMEDDLNCIFQSKTLPSALFIPKVDDLDHVKYISEELTKHLLTRSCENKLHILLYVESARSLLNLPEICKRCIEYSSNMSFELAGLVFGSDDFCADIGATRTSEAKETLVARQQVLIIAKAFHLQAIDIVYIDYKDLDGLRRQSEEGAGMGYTGKQVIHPSQVSIVQEAFSPSTEKIQWATELIKMFEEYQKSGKGAFTFCGAMIDRPLLLQAQNIVELAKSINTDLKL